MRGEGWGVRGGGLGSGTCGSPPRRRTRCSPGYRVQGSGYRVQGSGFRVQGVGSRVQGSGLRVHVSGSRLRGSGFWVQGSGLRVQGAGCGVQGFHIRLGTPQRARHTGDVGPPLALEVEKAHLHGRLEGDDCQVGGGGGCWELAARWLAAACARMLRVEG